MNRATWVLLAVGIGTGTAHGQSCVLDIEANDNMRYDKQSLQVSDSCSEVTVTLRHVGKLSKTVMGHDWVLTKSEDVNVVLGAGSAAGLANNYLQPGDPRVIAATPVVGGGESAVAMVSLSALRAGGSYTYFCSVPGHAAIMRGKFLIRPSTS